MSASPTTSQQKQLQDAADTASHHWVEIKPHKGLQMIDVSKLWQFRELLGILTMRDVKVRYKQTLLGASWAVIQPFTMMVVMSIFFGRFAGLDSKTGGIPYPIFLYAGMLPWIFFTSSVTNSTNSLVANAGMLRKIYFPRLILPLASVGTPLVDYAVAFGVLIGLMAWYNIWPGLGALMLPVLIGMTIVAALGVGILLSAMTVRFRDFRYVVPFMIQVWFFVTPVLYPVTIVPEKYQWILSLNPMGGTISAFRACVLNESIDFYALIPSFLTGLTCMIVGLIYFNQSEKSFADLV
ncbi:MAG TPA: phosphate ABC transporter permease [Phycisphaerales bacterium]|nr:phosphate ABC transporter permease [Phycisphaerales bacterium]HCD35119.1 phosphate ABC transporter permease [Phycisphaerales bacterium]